MHNKTSEARRHTPITLCRTAAAVIILLIFCWGKTTRFYIWLTQNALRMSRHV